MLCLLPPINPALNNLKKTVKHSLFISDTDKGMRKSFPPNLRTTLQRQKKNLKEILSPSLYGHKFKKKECSVSNCNKCNNGNNYLIIDNRLKGKVTARVYSIRDSFS